MDDKKREYAAERLTDDEKAMMPAQRKNKAIVIALVTVAIAAIVGYYWYKH